MRESDLRGPSTLHYQVNVCGGDFEHVKQCFRQWQTQPLVYRPNRLMFEGKREVRRASERVVHGSERGQALLREMCDPHDPYALALEVEEEGRDLWLVMAAYDD